MSIIEKAIEKAALEGEKLKQNNATLEKQQINESVTIRETDNKADINGLVSEKIHSEQRYKDISKSKPSYVPIDLRSLSDQGYLTEDNANVQLTEEFRIIKRPLVKNIKAAGGNGIKSANLILITSCLPSEGKTFTAINLALSIANERDKQVLLIDADVLNPSIAKIMGIKHDRPGLIEYLENKEIDFSEMIIDTNMPGLRIIQAGEKHQYSTELLASNRMHQLTEELNSRYQDRIVIFDSSPLLAATQAEVLAGLVGQIVMVVEAEATTQNIITEGISKLAMCDVVMLMLNKYRSNFVSGTYGYEYGNYGN